MFPLAAAAPSEASPLPPWAPLMSAALARRHFRPGGAAVPEESQVGRPQVGGLDLWGVICPPCELLTAITVLHALIYDMII